MTTKVNNISRTEAVTKIENSKGKFFTATWRKNNDEVRTLNCNFKKGNITKLGYITVHSKEGYKNINPRNLISLKINRQTFQIK